MPSLGSWTDLARETAGRGLMAVVRDFGAELAIHDLGWPAAEAWAAQALLRLEPEAAPEALDSLPFSSLCDHVLAPLMTLSPARQQQLFRRAISAWPREARLARLQEFFARPLGLTAREKVCWLSGERLGLRRPWTEDRLLKLLSLTYFQPLDSLRRKLIELGGIGPLAASLPSPTDPAVAPLASRVVTLCLLYPADLRHPCWPDLLKRCSPLERYVIVSQLAGKLDLYWNQRTETLTEILAEHYGVDVEQLRSAHALEDLPQLVERLEAGGAEALKAVVLRPLTGLRPALAVSLQAPLRFPCYVECKYDGIRILLHKELDGLGNQRVAAYTRRRHDWAELIQGLDRLLAGLPVASLILDGELHGRVLEDVSGVARPASVYEVHQALRGELSLPLRYIAFDLLYMNGQDLTGLPLQQRRARLEALLSSAVPRAGALPIELSQASWVTEESQLNRLYQQFRQRGHEGCMVKDPQAVYPLGLRSPAWQKRKPLETVDLVVVAAYWGEGSRSGARMFDSYELAAREGHEWKPVGTVGGVDGQLTGQLVGEIWRNNLLTGNPKERLGHSGTAQGVELRPFLVVTVAYEDLLWEAETRLVSLRSPRIQGLRSGELPLGESTSYPELEKLALRSRLS